MTDALVLEVCEACGELVPPGAWPYCKSARNPEGHSTQVTYRVSGGGMAAKGWTRRSR